MTNSRCIRKACPQPRRDGWTAARQLAFLHALAGTRSISRAAEAAGMSRESAYRLRARDPHGLFAAIWDLALAPAPGSWRFREGHIDLLPSGWLMRLLGTHFRRESGDFSEIGQPVGRHAQNIVSREVRDFGSPPASDGGFGACAALPADVHLPEDGVQPHLQGIRA
jgi:hypothetical protein